MGLVREVTTQGVGWGSEEVSDLVAPPLNLAKVPFVDRPCAGDEADLVYLILSDNNKKNGFMNPHCDDWECVSLDKLWLVLFESGQVQISHNTVSPPLSVPLSTSFNQHGDSVCRSVESETYFSTVCSNLDSR
jgi:hypothetical protein